MAHFAELNSSNEVLRVIVISNDDVNSNGGDYSSSAETFVASIVPYQTGGVSWKQTSYNNNARKQYAGVGYTYDSSKNKFIAPQPFNSWSLDSNDDWQAPVTYPSTDEVGSNILLIDWDEGNLRWTGKHDETNYIWDSSALSWSEV
jgi:hypothetical protein|tara:strand:- start:1172 stop:1609 length:438 start_codon:yes stop_codon:yes gene_type:complete